MRYRCASFLLLALLTSSGCKSDSSSGGGTPDYVIEENFTTKTADNWTISMHRYRRASGVSQADPVLLSQGYLEGSKVFNAFPKYSMANKLALDGFDVWSYDIRGTGDSQKPEISWSNVNFTIDWTNLDWSFGMPGWNYSVDHFVFLDTPAAVDFMLQKTGRSQFMWVAHSLGALMQYAYLQTSDAPKVKSAVSLGGIGFIKPGYDYQSLFADFFYGIGTFLAWILPSNLPLPLKWALDKLMGDDPMKWAAISIALDTVGGKLFWNHENMNANLVYQFMKYALPNTTTNCFKQFMGWASKGECTLSPVEFSTASTGGSPVPSSGNTGFGITPSVAGYLVAGQSMNVTLGLSKIKTPILVLSGGADLMCPPGFCEEVYSRITSTKKAFIECSKSTGHKVDYGHIDMTMGLFARNEVYSHVADWLHGKPVETQFAPR
jgi:pimeloyl-ACP methyl ester carboxylesterase